LALTSFSRNTSREYQPLTSYNLGLILGIQAYYNVRIKVDKDQELRASQLRNSSAEDFKMTSWISGTQVYEFRKMRLELIITKNNNSGTHVLEFRYMRSLTSYT
jgi:hypothetical protein